MMVLSMPVLPDCAACGCQVVLRVGSHERAVEECTGCAAAQPPMPPPNWQAYWRERVRVVVAQRKGKASC